MKEFFSCTLNEKLHNQLPGKFNPLPEQKTRSWIVLSACFGLLPLSWSNCTKNWTLFPMHRRLPCPSLIFSKSVSALLAHCCCCFCCCYCCCLLLWTVSTMWRRITRCASWEDCLLDSPRRLLKNSSIVCLFLVLAGLITEKFPSSTQRRNRDTHFPF